MTPQASVKEFNASESTSIRLTMRPVCVCGPGDQSLASWSPTRYDVEKLPPDQRAGIYQVAGGWNVKRVINGIEFRQYKLHAHAEQALLHLQLQIDEEIADFSQLSRRELQRRMSRYRFRA